MNLVFILGATLAAVSVIGIITILLGIALHRIDV